MESYTYRGPIILIPQIIIKLLTSHVQYSKHILEQPSRSDENQKGPPGRHVDNRRQNQNIEPRVGPPPLVKSNFSVIQLPSYHNYTRH